MSVSADPRPRPWPSWIGWVALLIVALGVAGIGAYVLVEGHHSSMAADLTGHWVQLGESGATDLMIIAESEAERSAEADSLLVSGSLEGRRIRGRIEFPRFPPWGWTARATLLGKRWSLRAEGARGVLKLIAEDGRVITLSSAQ